MFPSRLVRSLMVAAVLLNFLHDSEGLENVALNKPTQESGRSYVQSFATKDSVDGDLNTCSHTNIRSPNWWMVDLLQVYSIRGVWIQNRKDCCFEKLQNFSIELTVQNPKDRSGFPDSVGGVVCTHQIEQVSPSEPVFFPCDYPARGKYVRIIKYGFDALTFCELKAIAIKGFKFMFRGKHTGPAYTTFSQMADIIDCTRHCYRDHTCNGFQHSERDQVCELLGDSEELRSTHQDLHWNVYAVF